ncbi:24215_t:CDS:2, partial [Gigaspora margarita]
LNDNRFHKAALIGIEIWQSLGYTQLKSNELGSFKKQPHLSELALRIFSINPMQANCEQKFSMLKWILGDYQTNYNKVQTGANNETLLEDMFNDSVTLLIGEVFDLETEENSESFAVNTVQADSFDNLDYDLCDMLDNFLEYEKQSS